MLFLSRGPLSSVSQEPNDAWAPDPESPLWRSQGRDQRHVEWSCVRVFVAALMTAAKCQNHHQGGYTQNATDILTAVFPTLFNDVEKCSQCGIQGERWDRKDICGILNTMQKNIYNVICIYACLHVVCISYYKKLESRKIGDNSITTA